MKRSTNDIHLTAPLKNPVYRALWLATVLSNIGGWVHDVSAGWLMTSLAPSPFMVSLVQAATCLPVFLLSIPSGALADVIDRRRLLLISQLWLIATALALGFMTLNGLTTAVSLLVMTFLLECGTAISGPAWQAIVPEIVPGKDVRSAVMLNGVGINVARAIGPAIGGIVVATAGPAAAFFVNSVSFLAVAAVLIGWRRPHEKSVMPAERFIGAMKAGARYVRHAPAVKSVLIRTMSFMIGASALWALLPSIARNQLAMGPTGYGMMLGCLGVGALVGAFLMGRIRQIGSTDAILVAAALVFPGAMTIVAMSRTVPFVCSALLAAGAAWVAAVANLNATAQAASPNWVRARVMSLYLMVLFGAMTGGSVLWGAVSAKDGIPAALIGAATVMVLGTFATHRFRLARAEELDLTPSRHWADPILGWVPAPKDGPVLITVEYTVDSAHPLEFVAAMHALRSERMRDGAFQWGLFHDVALPGHFTENFLVESWEEHLRQHGRVSHADQEAEDRVKALLVAGTVPIVTHLIFAKTSR